MIQPGMMFGGEGPVMQGTWYNPNTGDAFTVRDSFFEDNQYVVTTTDGRYLHYNQLQNYVQTDMRLDDLKKQPIQNKQTNEQLPLEVSSLIDSENNYNDLILPEDNEILTKPIINKSLGNIYNDKHIASKNEHQLYHKNNDKSISMNTAIINKALSNTDKPNIIVDVDWKNFPSKQIEMLYDIMNISENEIVEWYLDNIKLDDVIKSMEECIKNKIIKKQENTVEEKIDNLFITNETETKSKKSTKQTKKNINKL